MSDLFKFGLTQEFKRRDEDKKIFGVTVAVVMENIDITGEGRVRLMLPWLPGIQPWARVSSQMAGMGRGTYFIPQPGDEVLVSFNHGDVREPYIVGSLWNTIDRPPALLPTDPVTKRSIRTPLGQELTFDEKLQSVTIQNTSFNSLTLDLTGAALSVGFGTLSIKLDLTNQSVSITAPNEISLTAPSIKLNGGKVDINSAAATSINAGGECAIRAPTVKINS